MDDDFNSFDPRETDFNDRNFNSYYGGSDGGPRTGGIASCTTNSDAPLRSNEVKLFVKGIPFAYKELQKLFSRVGKVNSVIYKPDRDCVSRCIAFVSVPSYDDATRIIERYNKFHWPEPSITMTVALARPCREKNEQPQFHGSAASTYNEFIGRRRSEDGDQLGPSVPSFVGTKLIPPLYEDAVFRPIASPTSPASFNPRSTSPPPVSVKSESTPSTTTNPPLVMQKASVSRSKLLKAQLMASSNQSAVVGKPSNSVDQAGLMSDYQCNEPQSNGQAGSATNIQSQTNGRGEASTSCRLPKHVQAKAAETRSVNNEQLPCSVCSQPTVKQCGRCQQAMYCGRDCQRKDWDRHKKVCQQLTREEQDLARRFDISFSDDVVENFEQHARQFGLDMNVFTDSVKRIPYCALSVNQLVEALRMIPAVSPSCFWLLPLMNRRKLIEISNRLNEYYSVESNRRAFVKVPEVGEDCAAIFSEDEQWYRARISSLESGERLQVCYVDYGNYDVVHMQDICVLNDEFYETPQLAVSCRLEMIEPTNGSEVWSAADIARFNDLITEKVVLTISQSDEVSGVLSLDTLRDNSNQDIVETLIEDGIARRTIRKAAVSDGESTALNGSSLSLNYPVGSELIKDLLIDPPLYPTAAKRLNRGNDLVVKVVNVQSPSQFWIQILSGSEYSKLADLQEQMKHHYGPMPNTQGFRPTGSMLYACPYQSSTGSKTWHRVQALDYDVRKVDVLFLDFGCRTAVPHTTLHSLEGQFISLPFQAVCCSLYGVRGHGGTVSQVSWTREAIECFKELVESDILHAYVCRVDDKRVNVELVLSSGENVAEVMIQRTVCEKATGCDLNICAKRAGDVSTAALRYRLIPSPFKSDSSMCAAVDKISDAQKRDSVVAGSLAESESKHTLCGNDNEKMNVVGIKVRHQSPQRVFRSDLTIRCLNVRETYQVSVMYVESPTCFFVHLIKKESIELLKQLDIRLNELYNTERSMAGVKVYQPHCGEIVAARASEDGAWYRAVVESQRQDGYVCQFIDYGNYDVLPPSEIREIDPALIKDFPVLLYCCALEGMESLIVGPLWGSNCLKPTELAYSMTVIRIFDNVHHVEMTAMDEPNVLVVDKFLADGVFLRKSAEVLKSGSANVVASKSPPVVMSSEAKRLVVDNKRVVKLGDIVRIVSSDGPQDFYVHVMKYNSMFNQLMTDLGTHCHATSTYRPVCGEMVAALRDDGHWCRANVTKKPVGGRVSVFFVDFGCYGDISTTHIRTLPTGFGANIRPWAVPCSIYELRPNASSSIKPNPEFTTEKIFRITDVCISSDDGFYVDLMAEGAKRTVREELIMSGVWQKSLEFPNSESVVLVESEGITRMSQTCGQDLLNATMMKSQQAPQVGEEVVVVYVNSPSHFYIQKYSDASKAAVKKLLNDLSQYSASGERLADVSRLERGTLVAALFEGCWYRAEIRKVNTNGNLLLYFIDYGNEDEVKLCDVRVLPPALATQLPKQAIMCQISGVTGSNGPNGAWSTESKEWFVDNCENQLFTVASIGSRIPLHGLESGDSVKIDLLSEGSRQRISEQLLRLSLAKTLPEADAENGDISMFDGNLDMDAPMKCVVQTDAVSLSLPRIESSPVVSVFSLPVANPPEPNSLVSIVHIISPDEFYIWQQSDFLQNRRIELRMELQNQFTMSSSMTSGSYKSLEAGQLVAGKFEGEWFRATVLEPPSPTSGGSGKLYFVDFGNTEVIADPNDVRPLSSELALSTPRQAVQCRLAGVKEMENGNGWTTDARNYFVRNTNNTFKVKSIEFASDANICEVDLESVDVNGVPSVVDDFVNQGFALRIAKNQRLPSTDDQAMVVHINNPSSFYIQLVSDAAQNAAMMSELMLHCQTAALLSKLPRAGELVAALFEGMWFRAEVIAMSGHTATVQFIDYGNISDVQLNDVRELPASFVTTMRRQAIHCQLVGVQPVNVRMLGTWSEEATGLFKEYFEDQPCSIVQLRSKSNELLEIDLKTPDMTASAVCFLTSKGHAINYTCIQIAPADCLRRGSNVTIVHVNTPDDFFVQIKSLGSENSSIRILHDLAIYFQTFPGEPYSPTSIGELVAARDDGVWYRAQVKDMSMEKRVTVEYIDFGNVGTVSPADIRSLPSQFIEGIPKMAIQCRLLGVVGTGSGGSWSSASVDWFINTCENGCFVVTAAGMDDVTRKCAIDFSSTASSQVSIADTMISQKLAYSESSTSQ